MADGGDRPIFASNGGEVFTVVRPPRIASGAVREVIEQMPYCTPSPFYQGSRVLFDIDALQASVQEWLERRGFCRAGEQMLVFSWIVAGGELALTVARHEAQA